MTKYEPVSLADLYDEYETKLHTFAMRLTHDPSRADDLMQNTFMRAMTHLKLFEMLKPYQRRAWLYRTLKNLFIDEERANQRHQFIVEQFEKASQVTHSHMEGLDTVNPFSLVPDPHRKLFEMRYVLGMTSREIAEQLGVPAGTVRSRLRAGMKRLRSQMDLF